MRPVLLGVAAVVVAVVVAVGACSGARPADVKLAPTGQTTSASPPEATPQGAGRDESPPIGAKEQDPLAGITGSKEVSFAGEDELLRWASGDDVKVAEHDLACLYDTGALTTPARADARLQNLADDLGIQLGRLRVVRVERPLGRGMEPRPRICRPIVKDALLYAPLFRVQEPAATWRMKASTTAAAGAGLTPFIAEVTKSGVTVASVPRAVVVRETVVALALPVR